MINGIGMMTSDMIGDFMYKSMNEYVSIYKNQLDEGDIQVAYEHLIKYMMQLKSYFSATLNEKYSFGNVSPGYMDYTYFPFLNDYLRNKKLRFGIILNHKKMRFELWLMGQNAEIQNRYWEIVKATKWNQGVEKMPKYSVLETVLVSTPDFDDLDLLSKTIKNSAVRVIDEIITCL